MRGKRWQSIAVMALAVVMMVMPIQVAWAADKLVDGDYEYIIIPSQFDPSWVLGTAMITKYTGAGGAVTIPSTLGGTRVTAIATEAFMSHSGLTRVVIPSGVTYIGDSAFHGCKTLASVTIPNSVQKIGDSAFWGCEALASVTIPNSVQKIGRNAFQGTGLTSVAIPSSVTTIEWQTFAFCRKLTSVSIPSSVSTIDSNAFISCSSLTSVDIPNSVTSLGGMVFLGCTSLTSVVLPDGLTRLHAEVFAGCTSLKHVVIPEGVLDILRGAFKGCTALTSVLIPSSTTRVGEGVFTGCTSLKTVILEGHSTEIVDTAFEGCTSLNGAYFRGDAPLSPRIKSTTFLGSAPDFKVYFLAGKLGWPTPGDLWNGYGTAQNLNEDPYLHAVTVPPVTAGSLLTFKLVADDRENDDLTYSLGAGAPAGARVHPETGVFTWTPTKAQGAQSYPIRLVVTDDKGGGDSEMIKVTVAAGPLVTSIQGDNRYATAVEASKKAFPAGSRYVVIATGENWPDALGGAALAGALDCPILLTPKGSLWAETKAEIGRLSATHVIVLGGIGAVSTKAYDEIKGVTKERLAGTNRYETATKVAARTIAERGAAYDHTAFIATGMNFPDALGASPLAAAKGWPIYLSNPAQGDNAALIATMKADGVTRALVLGGKTVVSDPILTKAVTLGSAKRLAGSDRYTTAIDVATYGVTNAGLTWDKLAIATGTNFPDALAGGALQGKSGSVMLLTSGTALNGSVGVTLKAHSTDINEVRFLGGKGAMSQPVRNAVESILK